MAVTEIPESSDLEIIIGDDYAGASLILSESPGTGTWAAVLEDGIGVLTDFTVVESDPTTIIISMPQTSTVSLRPGKHRWSLLFKQTSPTAADRTICAGGAVVKSYPTREK